MKKICLKGRINEIKGKSRQNYKNKTVCHAELDSASSMHAVSQRKMKACVVTNGFTLIEMLVVILIVAILAAIALPQYQLSVAKGKMTSLQVRFNALEKAVQQYYLSNGSFPLDIRVLDIGLTAPGVKYTQASLYTSNPEAKGYEYPSREQCAVFNTAYFNLPNLRKNVLECANKDLALAISYQMGNGLNNPDRLCSAVSAAGEKICKQLSSSKQTTQTYASGYHQWKLN